MLSRITFGKVIEGTLWNTRPKKEDEGDRSTVSIT